MVLTGNSSGWRNRGGARKLRILIWCCLLGSSWSFLHAAGAPATAAPATGGPQESAREIREKAFRCFAQGEFEAAIPEFEQLIQIFSDSKNSTIRMGMEQATYNLGLCYFFTANFPASEKSFLSYIKNYPHSEHTAEAVVYVADCRRLAGKNE